MAFGDDLATYGRVQSKVGFYVALVIGILLFVGGIACIIKSFSMKEENANVKYSRGIQINDDDDGGMTKNGLLITGIFLIIFSVLMVGLAYSQMYVATHSRTGAQVVGGEGIAQGIKSIFRN